MGKKPEKNFLAILILSPLLQLPLQGAVIPSLVFVTYQVLCYGPQMLHFTEFSQSRGGHHYEPQGHITGIVASLGREPGLSASRAQGL